MSPSTLPRRPSVAWPAIVTTSPSTEPRIVTSPSTTMTSPVTLPRIVTSPSTTKTSPAVSSWSTRTDPTRTMRSSPSLSASADALAAGSSQQRANRTNSDDRRMVRASVQRCATGEEHLSRNPG